MNVSSFKQIVATYVVMDYACYIISGWVRSTMTIFVKVWKLYIMVRILIVIECDGEKEGNFSLYVCSTLQNNSYSSIPKNIMGCNVFTPTRTSKQVDTQIINGMFTLKTWKMCNCMSQPHFGQVWGWNSHSQSWGFGVLRDSRMFIVRQQGPKHLALGCSWCHWKGLEV
jgi:hypothetical protein